MNNDYDSLWVNARILSLAPQAAFEIIDDAGLVVREGRIVWLGLMKDIPQAMRQQVKQEISVEGRLMTPGFVDCHTHLVYAGSREEEFQRRIQGESYQAILQAGGGIHATVRDTRAASFHELLQLCEKRARCMHLEGVTTLEIKSGYGLDLETEKKQLILARKLGDILPLTIKTSYLGAHVLPKEFRDVQTYLDFMCQEVLPILVHEDLVDAVDGFCDELAFSCEAIEVLFSCAKQHGLPVKLHTHQLSASQGIQLALKYNALSVDHLEFAEEKDLIALAKSKTMPVLLPGASYFLQQREKPPLDLLRQYNVSMAIASDCNPGTSPLISPLSLLSLACVQYALTVEEALRGFTYNGACALGIEKDYGSIEVGKMADFVLWDCHSPGELCSTLGGNPCYQVVKHGKVSHVK